MTKSSRHKKFRKQEKAKTQLTGVKKLSKAKNVVEPTLRVKKILIREQLKSASVSSGNADGTCASNLQSPSSQLSTGNDSIHERSSDTSNYSYSRRKQSVQELITSLNHHNVNIRKEALIGLQEISTSQFNAIVRNLDKVLSKIASLTSDQEAIVRKENLKLAELILSKVTESQLRPFWTMLIAHLKCTMTHLIPSIRYSALPFLTLLVDHHTILVSESSPIILPSILGLIATSSKPSDSKSSVTRLKVEITGKQNDLTARMKVLRLLNKCLVILSHQRGQNKCIIPVVEASKSPYLPLKYPFGYGCDQTQEIELKQMVDGLVSLYTDRFYSSITADPFSLSFTPDKGGKNSEFWADFIQNCIPVLIETWVESGPLSEAGEGTRDKKGKHKYNSGNDFGSNISLSASRRNGLHILNESAVESLLCVTTLFADLIERIGTSGNSANDEIVGSIRKTHGQNLLKHFYNIMPYVSLKESQKGNVISANLNLFLIAGKLKMFDSDLKSKLRSFILASLELPYLEKEHCESILSIFKYVDYDKDQGLCSNFLISAAKLNNCETVSAFLNTLICPTNQALSKSILQFMRQLKWEQIIEVLLQQWPRQRNGFEEETRNFLQVLTFAALRRLADLNEILARNVEIMKEIVSRFKSPTLVDAVYRVFFYSGADDAFKIHFEQFLNHSSVVTTS